MLKCANLEDNFLLGLSILNVGNSTAGDLLFFELIPLYLDALGQLQNHFDIEDSLWSL